MRILQVIPNFAMGGAEKIVVSYLREARRFDVCIMGISLEKCHESVLDSIISRENLPVQYLDKKKGLDLRMVVALRKKILDYKPDIIHTHLHALKYILLADIGLKHLIFHTIHGIPQKDTTKYDRIVNRVAFQKGWVHPVTLHSELAEAVNKYYKINNAEVVYNGINLRNPDFHADKSLVRRELKISENTFVVGTVGSFKEAKNQDFLIDIFSEILQRNNNSKLMLVGDGPLRNQIKDKIDTLGIGNKVDFMGIRDDACRLMRAMDVFVMPSKNEGFGIAAIEAQAAGIRTVVSDKIPDAVMVSNRIHRISLVNNAKEWAAIILDNKWEGQNYHDICEYDQKRTCEKLFEMYSRALNNEKSQRSACRKLSI